MAKDNQINVRVNDRVNEAIEDFAETNDYTKTEAVRRMVEGRLAGEGYIDGVAITDGAGLSDEVEATRNEIENARDELQEVQKTVSTVDEIPIEDIEKTQNYVKSVGPMLGAAVVWILIQSSVGIPNFGQDPLVTVLTGIVIVVALVYRYIQVMFLD